MTDICPFLSGNLNKIFLILIKSNLYKKIALYHEVLEICANIRVFEILSEKSKDPPDPEV